MNLRTAGSSDSGVTQLRIVEGPDEAGNGAWMLELRQTASDGTGMETLEHFTLDENLLRMEIEMRPAVPMSRSKRWSWEPGPGP